MKVTSLVISIPFLLYPLQPPLPYIMCSPFYDGIKACTQLKISTHYLRLVPSFPHNKFSKVPAERLPYPHGAYPWLLIKCHYAAFHYCAICVPGGGLVSHPVIQAGDDDYQHL